MPNILLISPENWFAHTVSKHHYARTLVRKGSKVFFLNPPEKTFRNLNLQQNSNLDNLFIVNGPCLARGLRFYPSILRQRIERLWLQKLENISGSKIDVVWLFENSRFFDMNFAGSRLKIYHQVDLNQEFNPAKAASTADICFCTTDYIKQVLDNYNKKVYKIRHGLAVTSQTNNLTDNYRNKFRKGTVNAVYVGNLEMKYLDIDLLVQTVKEFPEVHFHFIGGYNEKGRLRNLTKAQSNITWWGKVDYSQIPVILKHADVLLVTYQASRYRDQASPHKLLEYLASGKTVVATYTDEYKDKRHLLEIVDDSNDYLNIFGKVIQNLDNYNNSEKQSQRIDYANDNTYDKQLERIETKLRENGLMSLIN